MLSAPLLTPAEKKYQCYYPHRSRDSVSPVCGIFTNLAPLGPTMKELPIYFVIHILPACRQGQQVLRMCQTHRHSATSSKYHHTEVIVYFYSKSIVRRHTLIKRVCALLTWTLNNHAWDDSYFCYAQKRKTLLKAESIRRSYNPI